MVDELAAIWCGWAEMEMHDENYKEALRIMETAVREPPLKKRKAAALQQDDNFDDKQPVSERLYKNVKVWSLYLDLEESLGTIETCRAAYDRVMDLKVITAQMALNYAAFLEEKEFFEDSFRVFERAVSLFSFPTGAKKIWLVYLDKFMARYEGTKLERLRDLFEQAVAQVPPEDAAEFYVKFAKAEEAYGLARHAMAVYDRATRAVPESSRLDMYRLYIKKIEQHFGITKTRPAYERAISELNDDMTRDICIEYAEMERKLGEIDRARAILQHGSQFADPRRAPMYWIKWREFEELHGNEDTFRDMLRVQRSVETAFSQVNYLAAELGAGAGFVPASSTTAAAKDLADLEQHAELEAEGNNKRKFVPSTASSSSSNKIPRSSEEIDIDDVEVQQKPVPRDVFGAL
jgi:pre-mRNA-splicing factor SYF1